MRLLVLLFVLSALLMNCRSGKPILQGVSGQVLWFEGDLMPGINKQPVAGKPVVREIFFYAPTHTSQAMETDYVFYSEISTQLIEKIKSGEDGRFEIRLDPGTYSV